MVAGALFIGCIAAFIFGDHPEIDMAIARTFYLGDGQFLGNQSAVSEALRQTFVVAFWVCCVLIVVGLCVTQLRRPQWLSLQRRQWLFLALCLIAGPLLVTNLGFKDHWGRARPHQVIEFGGQQTFSGPLVPSSECKHNCSFVSGEASSVFMLLFAAALVFRSQAPLLILVGTFMGSLAGLTRISQGAHFLSDVIFAGVFMAMIAASLDLLLGAISTKKFDYLSAKRQMLPRRSSLDRCRRE